MDASEYKRLVGYLSVLKDVAREYPTHSIGNIIQQIESRIKNEDERRKKETN